MAAFWDLRFGPLLNGAARIAAVNPSGYGVPGKLRSPDPDCDWSCSHATD